MKVHLTIPAAVFLCLMTAALSTGSPLLFFAGVPYSPDCHDVPGRGYVGICDNACFL